MSKELEGRQWFVKVATYIFIACVVLTLASMESIVELVIGWMGL